MAANGNGNGISGVLRRLAKVEAGEVPILSAYLDLRPHATGDPNMRAGLMALRTQLREIEKGLTEHTPAAESFRTDVQRIDARVEEALPEARGIAVVSSAGQDLFEAVEFPVSVESRIDYGPLPVLVPLAQLADQAAALLAVCDTNTLRLFLIQHGGIRELPGHDVPPDEYGKHLAAHGVLGGRVDERRAEFAREASEVIDRTVAAHEPSWFIASEDDVALPILRDKLSKRAETLLRETVRMDVKASYDDILGVTLPIVERLRREDAHASADDLVGEVGEKDLGVAGIEETRLALERGQGRELLLDEQLALPGEELEALVRLAATTDTRVRFVDGHEGLSQFGGVGALLRFRVDPVDPAD